MDGNTAKSPRHPFTDKVFILHDAEKLERLWLQQTSNIVRLRQHEYAGSSVGVICRPSTCFASP